MTATPSTLTVLVVFAGSVGPASGWATSAAQTAIVESTMRSATQNTLGPRAGNQTVTAAKKDVDCSQTKTGKKIDVLGTMVCGDKFDAWLQSLDQQAAGDLKGQQVMQFLAGPNGLLNSAHVASQGTSEGQVVSVAVFSVMLASTSFMPPVAGSVVTAVAIVGLFVSELFGRKKIEPEKPPHLTDLTTNDFKDILRSELESGLRARNGADLMHDLLTFQDLTERAFQTLKLFTSTTWHTASTTVT